MKFVLFDKLKGLEGVELIMLIIAAALFVVILTAAIVYLSRRKGEKAEAARPAGSRSAVRALVMGALCVTLSFILSYIKLFSMPMGGSITLCSMLPITMYACWYGPKNGFLAAIAYAGLQMLQGMYIVHWAQFLLDYVVAFSCFALAAFFPKKLPLGIGVAGLARMLVSTVSGIIFFSDAAAEAGYQSAVWYSVLYNGSTIGLDTLICVVIALLPPVAKTLAQLKPKAA